MSNEIETVADYMRALPPDRRAALQRIRKVILENLPEGYKECFSYGMIGYVVPHSIYPAGYHCNPKLPLTLANLGSQKNHMSLHVMTVYGDPTTEKWLRQAWHAAGKKLDMGKCCIRFKKLEDVPLAVVGRLIARVPIRKYIARVEQSLASRAKKSGAKAK